MDLAPVPVVACECIIQLTRQDELGARPRASLADGAAVDVVDAEPPGPGPAPSCRVARRRRRHVRCAGMDVPVLNMTASERRSF